MNSMVEPFVGVLFFKEFWVICDGRNNVNDYDEGWLVFVGFRFNFKSENFKILKTFSTKNI